VLKAVLKSTIDNQQSSIPMPVGVLTLEIQLPYSHSLKEKRAVLRKMRDRLRARFNVAVAELNAQDVWQHATLGVVSISDRQDLLEAVFNQVLAEAERVLGQDVASHTLDFFE
jgi:hypothetical protein